jgi:hypothetical protein
VLSRRLNGALLGTLAATILVGCGDKPIEDNLVRPGITAIDDARDEACGMNASAVRTAVEAYTMLEGDPPPDEQALVDEGYLRETTTDWDVVDGELVAENPACGPVGETATPPTLVDIVTESIAPATADEILAEFPDDLIDAVGGPECARELAVIGAAGEAFVARVGRDPVDLAELAGDLDPPVSRWMLDDQTGELVPTADSECHPIPEADDPG